MVADKLPVLMAQIATACQARQKQALGIGTACCGAECVLPWSLQIFNQFNARKIRDEYNVFSGLWRSRMFIYVMVLILGFQARPFPTKLLSSSGFTPCLCCNPTSTSSQYQGSTICGGVCIIQAVIDIHLDLCSSSSCSRR